eukprot:m.227112 g.227112  ORF g.227112 m.227112 type:complete len:396 (+) comp15174_c0_seq3:172-1359(+)
MADKEDQGNVVVDDDTVPSMPNMALAQLNFGLASGQSEDKAADQQALLDGIKADNMVPFYKACVEAGSLDMDAALLKEMEEACAANVEKLGAAIADAEENLGESEIREALLARADHFCTIADKDEAVTAYRAAYDKAVSVGQKMDICFSLIRLGLFYNDGDLVKRNCDRAEHLLEEGGDWERRNRLKVYRGMYAITVRDFSKAASLLLDTVSTFTCTELLTYQHFIGLTVLVSLISLDRPTLKEKVVDGPEIQECLHELKLHKTFLMALYNCNYSQFFSSLLEIESVVLRERYMHMHTATFVREARVLAYRQLLQSYRSVTLDSMAAAFGVSTAFMDQELSRFIAAGRLNCKINSVDGVVESTRPDAKNMQYKDTIKKGDILLNRIQKLGQILSM